MSTSFSNVRPNFSVSKELASSTATGHVIFTAKTHCRLEEAAIRSETLWGDGDLMLRKRTSGSVEAISAAESATLVDLTAAKDLTSLVARTEFPFPLTGTRAERTFAPGDQLVAHVASGGTPAVGTVVDAEFVIL
jgi:hypothetical protein